MAAAGPAQRGAAAPSPPSADNRRQRVDCWQLQLFSRMMLRWGVAVLRWRTVGGEVWLCSSLRPAQQKGQSSYRSSSALLKFTPWHILFDLHAYADVL